MSAAQPLPAWAVESNGELMLYLRSLTFKAFPADFLIQIKFYLGFKCALILIGLFLVAKLMLTGRWWLFRVVQVPNGKIICPNACEALFLSACIFYLIDLVYRGYSIRWCTDIFSEQQQSMLVYCIRIYFLWLAGFIHTASTMLIWPLNPAQLRPAYWHAFLFGVPVVHFVVFIVPSVMFDVSGGRANSEIVAMLRQLSTLPAQGSVSADVQLRAAELREQLSMSWRWATVMAAVLFSFLALITISSIASGYTIISRTARRYRQLKSEASEAIVRNMSTISASQSNTSTLSRASTVTAKDEGEPHYYETQSNDVNWRKVGLRRLALYVVGAKPLRQIGRPGTPTSRDSMSIHATARTPPSPKAVLAVLKDFLIFSIIHHGAIVGIMFTMLACVLVFLVNARGDLYSTVHDPTFVTAFGRTTYIFLVMEVYAIIVLGTPLVICVLWRQIYPICVDIDNDVYTRKERRTFVRSDGSPRKSDVDLSPSSSEMPARWVPTTRLSSVTRHTDGDQDLYRGAISMSAGRKQPVRAPIPDMEAGRPTNEEVRIAMDRFVTSNVERVALGQREERACVQRNDSARPYAFSDGVPTDYSTKKKSISAPHTPPSPSTARWETPPRVSRDLCGVTGVHPGVRQIVLDAIEAGASDARSPSPSSPPRSTLLERRSLAQHRQRAHQRSVDLERMMSAEQK